MEREGRSWLVGSSRNDCDSQHGCERVDDRQIELCKRWFSQAEATEAPCLNSFWLKHVVENWAGEEISNGAVIIAAYQSGFPIGHDTDRETANVNIGVSTACVDEFDCGCGHP